MRRNFKRGFTLFEMLVVIALSTLLVALTVPTGFRFYQTQVLDETLNDIVIAMDRAQFEALSGKNDRAFGVLLGTSSYVLFQGNTYATRVANQDEIVLLPQGATLSGLPSEINFAKLSGAPSATGTLSISVFGATKSLILPDNGVARMQ